MLTNLEKLTLKDAVICLRYIAGVPNRCPVDPEEVATELEQIVEEN